MFSLSVTLSVISHDLYKCEQWADWNSIPKIETNINDKFYYGEESEIRIPELEGIEKYLQSQSPKDKVTLQLKADNNTLKSEL